MRLRVAGWTYPRHAFVRDSHILMEVARIDCSHCTTCSHRMDVVASRLRDAGVDGSWERESGGYYLSVPYDRKVAPARFLSELLKLSISPA